VITGISISQIKEFLIFLTIPFVNLNFIDIAIILIIAFYAFEGYVLGFIRATADFITFILSFSFGLIFYEAISLFLFEKFQIPKGIGNALGFFIAAFISEIFFLILFRSFLYPFITQQTKKYSIPKEVDRFTGAVPGTLSGIVLISFVLTMIVALPVSAFLKNAVSASRLGNPLVSNIQGIDKDLNEVFGRALSDALTFLTIEPESKEFLKLNFEIINAKIQREQELQMLSLINSERKKENLTALSEDQSLREVARDHCRDMLERGYFSHYTPEGRSPFDRMAQNDIIFEFAGENLALAPNAELAMQGLIRSPGHRANILSENFGRVGVGAIDAGIYGEMFCQEFTD